MAEKVLVAMSGGIDSSMTALLLQQEGYEVTGVFMRNGIAQAEPTARSCCSIGDAYDARRVANRLGIPFYAVNFSEGFERIIDDFVSEYNAGRTPNPCVLCNRDLKFGRLLDYASALGIERVATGHYARVERRDDRWALLRSADPAKDQTYMLFPLSQKQLSRTLLPLGPLTKPRVRALAREGGLSIAGKPDSQEICFVPGNDYRALMRERSPDSIRPGRFTTAAGEPLGSHEGHQNFTIGQRKGLGVAMGRRMYVVDIRPDTNTVVLGEEEELLRGSMRVDRVNWVSIERPVRPRDALVRIRHGHAPVSCVIEPEREAVEVRFEAPQKIVTPGQSAVFYDGDLVLGGGWISSAA